MPARSIEVTKGQVVYILVTGNNGDDYGPFKLAIDLAKEGSSLATATFIGSDAKMEVSGSTQGYSDTYVNTRCNGNVTADGPDVVRGAAWRVAAALLFCTAMSQSCLRCNAACSAVLQSSCVCALFCLGAARGGLPATHPAARLPPLLAAVLFLFVCHCRHGQGEGMRDRQL